MVELRGPEGTRDALTELLGDGARELIRAAVEEEFASFLEGYREQRLSDGRHQVVRNGYLPEREFHTGVSAVPVRVPRCRDRGGEGIKFTSTLLPPYLRRSRSIEELLPWLYLKGISTNDFNEALQSLLGKEAAGLSPSTISRLKADWEQECEQWKNRDLSRSKYVYLAG